MNIFRSTIMWMLKQLPGAREARGPSGVYAPVADERQELRREHVELMLDPVQGVNVVRFPDGGPLRA